jgi:carboxyl-terminal processing protease
MKRWLAIFLVAVILVGTLATGLLGGVLLDRHLLLNYVPPQEIPADAQADFGLMAEAWNLIEQWYVDRSAVDGTTLPHGAIAGMANALGDTGHTRFLTPEEVAASRESERGSFEGIGAAVQMVDDEGGHRQRHGEFPGQGRRRVARRRHPGGGRHLGGGHEPGGRGGQS